jgi:DNA-binding NarL/FixJ family response regulator
VTAVVVVEDHELVSDGLARLICQLDDFTVAATCGSGDELLALLGGATHVDMCTVDLMMPGISGLELLRALRDDWPDVRVLVCSGNASAEAAVRCLQAGANGFISKFRPGSDFIAAVRKVADGERYIDPDLFSEVLGRLTADPSSARRHEALSAREYAVMEALAAGSSIKDIAAALYLSPKTVSTYRSRVLAKLGVESNAAITAYALRHGLIQVSTV